MSNKWEEMRSAYKQAEQQIKAADNVVVDMARMIKGRLRTFAYFDCDVLAALKKELRDFNIQTRRWKS